MTLPALLSVPEIHERLKVIFPEGTPNRKNCTWEIAARTVFVMLYLGTIEGRDSWLRPDQVTRMTDDQAARTDDAARLAWVPESTKKSKGEIPGRWYAGNTRESIRDDTIRAGFLANGVVIERPGVATTSSAGRYALKASFAALFEPALQGDAWQQAVEGWQAANLSAGALARITIRRKGAAGGGAHVLVTFPNQETRTMAVGDSSVISKAVIEVFAKNFLAEPAVIFLSESKNKVVERDDTLASSIGLHIQAEKNLPDIILADLGPEHPLIVFVEVVATDGPVTPQRQEALLTLTAAAGFKREHVAFVTAYLDRSAAAFKRTVDSLAWGSFAWFVSEPDSLVQLYHGGPQTVRRLTDWPL